MRFGSHLEPFRDSRLVKVGKESVSFRWKNRDRGNRMELLTLPGIQFVERYLCHVLPKGLRSIRYYGFCHPAAKAKRLRVQFHSGLMVQFGAQLPPQTPGSGGPRCPHCQGDLRLLLTLKASYRKRGPPRRKPISHSIAA